MIISKFLQKGDKIGITSTARKLTFADLGPAILIFEKWGLEVVFGKHLFESYNQFSGTIRQRTSDFQSMLDDTSIKAIFCARGGYGTVQIIDEINFSTLENIPKWIIGYSDVTVLHSHLNNLGFSSLHATMPINFSNNTSKSLCSLQACLFGNKNIVTCDPHIFNRHGKVEAEIVGGNLSILYSLIGSNSDINTDGKILFIEDLDEYLYHIDRMIMNMKRNGKFRYLKGMIVGGMTEMNDNKVPFGKSAEEIILFHIKEFSFPICFNFPSGHLDDNRAIILGVKTVLDINESNVSLLQNTFA